MSFTIYGYLCVEVNGSNTKDQFLPLYTSTESGTASDRDFWGCIYDASDLSYLTQAGFLSMQINGTEYWMKIYTAYPVACDCCTNLSGTWRDV